MSDNIGARAAAVTDVVTHAHHCQIQRQV
jgi:hypothetical protein